MLAEYDIIKPKIARAMVMTSSGKSKFAGFTRRIETEVLFVG